MNMSRRLLQLQLSLPDPLEAVNQMNSVYGSERRLTALSRKDPIKSLWTQEAKLLFIASKQSSQSDLSLLAARPAKSLALAVPTLISSAASVYDPSRLLLRAASHFARNLA